MREMKKTAIVKLFDLTKKKSRPAIIKLSEVVPVDPTALNGLTEAQKSTLPHRPNIVAPPSR